jgi:hypothetical protein
LRSPPPPEGAAAAEELAEVQRLVAARTEAGMERARWWNAGGPAYRWSRIAVEEMLDNFVTIPLAARHLALVHAAISDAVVTASASRQTYTRKRPTEFAAAASAAAGVLGYIFADRSDALRAAADEAMRTRVSAGLEFPSDVAAGRAIGERVAAIALEHGKADGSDRKWAGEIPKGPGMWNGTNPINPAAATWQPCVLPSPDAVRPGPPLGYDSPELLAQLAELKSLERTPWMRVTGLYWETFGGTRAFALWNDEATRKILEYGLAADPPAAAQALVSCARNL